jgi:PiT family inorganic phosphate transporter
LSFAHGANDVANAIWPLAAINDIVSSHGNIGVSASIPLWIMIIGAIGLALWLGIYGAKLIKTVGGEITKLNQIRAYCVALSAGITVIIASLLGLPVSSTHIAIGGIFWVGLFKQWRKHRAGKTKDYVNKSAIKRIALAWVVTLPISWAIAGVTYLTLMNFF